MKLLSSIVLAIATVASGAAAAATYNSDADRREQNREEALARWRADHSTMASAKDRDMTTRPTMGERTRTGARTVREKTHQGANSVRHFTHRQAEKARNFSDRQDRRYGKKGTPNSAKGEGGN